MLAKNELSLRNILVELWSTLLVALLVLNVGFDFLFYTPILYLFIRPFSNGGPVFSFLTNWLMHWVTPSIIGPPFAWCGMRIRMDNLETFTKAKKRNILILSNHGSRVDWVGARFIGFACKPLCRVNFVAESFLKFMPAIGWHCYWICEDIFVRRSFKSDRVLISKRVENMRRATHPCMIFVAPEGMVVDTTSKRNVAGKLYLANCQQFCKDEGYPIFEYVLTPRYKGISVLKEHTDAVGGKTLTAILAYTRDGKLLNQRLDSWEREIPDLYTLYAGIAGSPIIVYAHIRTIELSDDPTELKRIMMKDYERKDKLMKYFDEHGCFPDEGCKFEELKVPFFIFNFFHFLHTLSVILIMEALNLRLVLVYGFSAIMCSVFILNTVGKFIFGYSIESVPFETAIKPLVHLYYELFSDKLKEVQSRRKKATETFEKLVVPQIQSPVGILGEVPCPFENLTG